jgi:hypothetical protein
MSIVAFLTDTFAIRGAGAWLHLTERHEHEHRHERMVHTHPHVHEPMTHSHPHYPDLHHRHRHDG